MPISKATILQSLSEQQEKSLKEYERAIDEALRERYDGTPLWIGISPPQHKRVRDEISKRYQAAGWNIRYEYDQRDGSAIVLS